MQLRRFFVLSLLAAALLLTTSVMATRVLHMNLGDLCDNAERIFRGVVVAAEPVTIEAGGGQLPAIKYRVLVNEGLKGNADFSKGEDNYVEVQMLGTLKNNPKAVNGQVRLSPFLRDLPSLKVGEEYLLFTTAPSSVGLSTTVGLGQGCFSIFSHNKEDMAVNGLNNAGLFRGMDVTDMPTQGAMSYEDLKSQILQQVGR